MNEEHSIFSTQFYEEEIQSFCEANYGRELTEIELNRMKDYIWENSDVDWARMVLMDKVIGVAMDNTEGQWTYVDKDYLSKTNHNE